ncbi:phosphoglycolate phosphatase-like HAD superfamily hydrolase [Skermanella aerolata]|uniref:HAD family hydrolase n=1 Tax=Skermanella aerolata TaxID=393310 RepID=UPI003D25328F
MTEILRWSARVLLMTFTVLASAPVMAQENPLPSWNEGPAKTAIVDFIERVTNRNGQDWVPPEDRVATFDNDGTLWSEQPIYFQGMFVFDRIKAMAPQHPEWREEQPFKAALEGDLKTLAAGGMASLNKLLMTTHTGMTTDEFAVIVTDWLKTARHPRFQRPYNELTFQPMVELIGYLQQSGFRTYIVSGGGVEFMRTWAEDAYGIPPERVIGSTIKLRYELDNDKPALRRLSEIEFIDDGPGKPVAIGRLIGKRPIFAAGNSDGDLQMLQWTTLASGPRFGLIVHHTDGEREWEYDRQSMVGKLDKALDEAPRRGWTVVDMKKDWRTVYFLQ